MKCRGRNVALLRQTNLRPEFAIKLGKVDPPLFSTNYFPCTQAKNDFYEILELTF